MYSNIGLEYYQREEINNQGGSPYRVLYHGDDDSVSSFGAANKVVDPDAPLIRLRNGFSNSADEIADESSEEEEEEEEEDEEEDAIIDGTPAPTTTSTPHPTKTPTEAPKKEVAKLRETATPTPRPTKHRKPSPAPTTASPVTLKSTTQPTKSPTTRAPRKEAKLKATAATPTPRRPTRQRNPSPLSLKASLSHQQPREEITKNSTQSSSPPLRVLAYSLWGSKPRYIRGMVNVAKHIPKVFSSEWQVWIYHDNSVPTRALGRMKGKHVKFLNVEADTQQFPKWVYESLSPPTWRFLVASNPEVDAYCIRDSDSLPSHREFLAVSEFINSGKGFHLMRDHPWHHPHLSCPILAGMWGARSWALPNMDSLLKNYYASTTNGGSIGQQQRKIYGTDQDFLWNIVLPRIYDNVLQHDSYNCREANAIAFPITREESDADGNNPYWYVGNLGAQKKEGVTPDHFTDLMVAARPRFDQCLADRRQKESQLRQKGIPPEQFGKYFNTTFTGKLSGSYILATQTWNEKVRHMNNSYY